MSNDTAAIIQACVRQCATSAFSLGLLLLGLLADSARAQSIDAVDISPGVVLEDRYPERRFEFPNGVSSLADVNFAVRVGYRPLTLDLYLPPRAGQDELSHPLVVMVHGGGWESGHPRHAGAFADWPAALAAFANDGFIVASVEYRLSKEAPFPAAFDDVRDAIRWLRRNASRFGINRDKVVVMGGSAGGQLVGLVGTACGNRPNPAAAFDTGEREAEESACVQGIVAWYGVFDFGALVPSGSTGPDHTVPELLGRYLGCGADGCSANTVREASAINWVDAADPPFLMIHGVDDEVVSVEQSRAMNEALKKAGVHATLIEIPGVRHSFIGDTPDTTTNASRRAWDASITFIRELRRDNQAASR
jgi:acetyl esterase/lipase